MCLLLWSYDQGAAAGPLFTIAGNRDEFFHRPTREACWHQFRAGTDTKSDPSSKGVCFPTAKDAVLSGLDLEAGGTWLGLTYNGYFATITNYTESKDLAVGKKSRGTLVRAWLEEARKDTQSLDDVDRYLAKVNHEKMEYPGFNLLLGKFVRVDGMVHSRLGYLSNREDDSMTTSPRQLAGIHGLGNSTLNTPWEKVGKGVKGMSDILESTATDETIEKIFSLLTVQDVGGENPIRTTLMVPKTLLPNPFPKSSNTKHEDKLWYGTRVHTFLSIDKRGHVTFIERNAAEDADSLAENKRNQRLFKFNLV